MKYFIDCVAIHQIYLTRHVPRLVVSKEPAADRSSRFAFIFFYRNILRSRKTNPAGPLAVQDQVYFFPCKFEIK